MRTLPQGSTPEGGKNLTYTTTPRPPSAPALPDFVAVRLEAPEKDHGRSRHFRFRVRMFHVTDPAR